MDIDQLYQECLGMKVDEKRQFELDQVPDEGALVAITMALALQGAGVSFLQLGTAIYAQRFEPRKQDWANNLFAP